MREKFWNAANLLEPELFKTDIRPEFDKERLKTGDKFVLDLKNHYVGYLSFKIGYYRRYLDAPVKLTFKFCETEREIDDDFSEYKGGLSPSWLQEDTFSFDFPEEIKLVRRYACRYIVVTVVNTPSPLKLSDFCFTAVTSADVSKLKAIEPEDAQLKKIHTIAVNTLKNCMQRFFEDGPKRDRRLWIGDLRLEALTNYYTFSSNDLVKRCLYLFAACEPDDEGFMTSNLWDYPKLAVGDWQIFDYALLYVVTLCEYYEHTGDRKTVSDLIEVCDSQIDAARRVLASKKDETKRGFIDWCEGLSKNIAMAGVYLFTLEKYAKMLVDFDSEKSHSIYNELIEKRKYYKNLFFDPQKKIFISEKDGMQKSVHSQVWAVLGGVLGGDEAVFAIESVLSDKDALKPMTPYMHHYVAEAFEKAGATDKAIEYIRKIWGDMCGYDTFPEAYEAGNPDFSPYRDRMVNSMCHAWSCSPAYFIAKYAK